MVTTVPTEMLAPTSTPQPPATNTPGPAPTNSSIPSIPREGQPGRLMPEETVRRYYDLLDRRQFEATYAMLSVAAQKQEGSPVRDRQGWMGHSAPPVGPSTGHYKHKS